MTKVHANKGVPRNKKPLKNITYTVEVMQYKSSMELNYEKYKFKDLGYLVLYYHYGTDRTAKISHGFITPDELKELLGPSQWPKFCTGRRVFIKQRRVDGKNVKSEPSK